MNEYLKATESHIKEFGESSRRLGAMAMQNEVLQILLDKTKDVGTTDEQRSVLHEVFGSISELTIGSLLELTI